MKPVPVGKGVLLGTLRDMIDAIERDDSFGGTITYEALPERHTFEVMAFFRIGNSEGQGGSRILGGMVEEPPKPKATGTRKTKQQIADETYLRLNTPDHAGALPGQTSMLDPGETVEEAAPSIGLVPLACPNCNRGLPLAHGWAYSREAPWTIQCPSCGKRYEVPEEDHHEYRQRVRDYYASLKQQPLAKKTHRRNRGAR